MQKYLINDGQFRVSENGGASSTLLACRQLLLKFDSESVLIDTGIGNREYPEPYFRKFTVHYPRGLQSSLSVAGVSQESVTKIVLTHLHFDHAGGYGLADNGIFRPVFTNALLYVQQMELTQAQVQLEKGSSSIARCNVEPLLNNDQVKILQGDYQLTPEIRLLQVGGHTPGLQIVQIQDAEQIYYFPSDLLPTPYHINHDLNAPGIDYDKKQMQVAKVNLLEAVLNKEAILIFNHSPAITAGRIIDCKNGKYTFKSVKLKDLSTWDIL